MRTRICRLLCVVWVVYPVHHTVQAVQQHLKGRGRSSRRHPGGDCGPVNSKDIHRLTSKYQVVLQSQRHRVEDESMD